MTGLMSLTRIAVVIALGLAIVVLGARYVDDGAEQAPSSRKEDGERPSVLPP